MWGKGKDRDWSRHGVKDRANLLETVTRINVAFQSKISRDYPLYPIYLFFLLSYFFFNSVDYLLLFIVFFLIRRERKEVGGNARLGRPEGARVRGRSRKGRRGILSKLHGLPVKIHGNEDYNARRGEIYCAENSRDTFAMHLIILKKNVLSLYRYHGWKWAKCSKLCGRIIIITLYRNYND